MTQPLVPDKLPPVIMKGSDHLYQWLNDEKISLAFTTYQTNRLFLVGCKPNGRLAVNERLFDKPMGLYACKESLYMVTRYQIWELENRLAKNELHQGYDRLYVPSRSYTTGDLNVHDLVVTEKKNILFINTDFSCLATLQTGFSFAPLWKPPFITRLVAEDRCHLNGLAMQNGEPMYVTACSVTDNAAGWRNYRDNGGVVIHVPSNEIIATGLSMPHSPRWYRGKLWLLNSGTGEFGYLEGNKFESVTFCPGFVRGLAFWRNYALIGLSRLRSRAFSGLPIEVRLAKDNTSPQCALFVVELYTGNVSHVLHIGGVVEELYDVVVLPDVCMPKTLGFQDQDIDRLICFPYSGGIITTKPTIKRPSWRQSAPVSGIPRFSQLTTSQELIVKYQRIYHLTLENLVTYEKMIEPSLQKSLETQTQRGELFGIAASVGGEMVGLAVAERWQEGDQSHIELLSSYVLPTYRNRSIEKQLYRYLQQAVNHSPRHV